MNGDSYVDVNLEAMMTAHKAKMAAMTVVCEEGLRHEPVWKSVDGRRWQTGFLRGEGGTPFGGYINAGVYLLSRGLVASAEEDEGVLLGT